MSAAATAAAPREHDLLLGAVALFLILHGLFCALRPDRMVAARLRWIDRLNRRSWFAQNPDTLKRLESSRFAVWTWRIGGVAEIGLGLYLLLVATGAGR